MSWGLVAVAGATVVSGVMGSSSASKAARSADRATEATSEASAKQLAFEQQRYDDWNATYGPIQDNLADYYSNVSPDYYAAIGLETFEQQYQTSQTRMAENLVQRGIDPSSGIAASLESQGELNAAETRAGIRREAPRQAMEDKSRFLQIGMGQNPASSVSGAFSQQTQVAQQNAMTKANMAASSASAAGQAWAAAIPTVGRAIDAYNKPVEGAV